MYLNGADHIWETWSSGGPFIGERRANARVLVDPDWQLLLDTSAQVRGRGTWWRDPPSTLSAFATATSWVVDSRTRAGVRSFQRVRDGEWTWWEGEGNAGGLGVPSGAMTRAAMAVYLEDQGDTAYQVDPDGTRSLPIYDGTIDYSDISAQSAATKEAIGRLSQAGVLVGFPDGTFKPTSTMTSTQKETAIERLEDYLWGDGEQPARGSIEVPNVLSVQWDRSIDTDAAECTIQISNIKMKVNTGSQADPDEFGLPGYYTPTRGESMDDTARWPNHAANEWAGILLPNTIVRTFEGYGGTDLTIREAVDAGYLRQTGTWLVDRVNITSDGQITLQARDMARLLIEQFVTDREGVVPAAQWPLRYCRYTDLDTGERRSGNYFDYMDIIYDLVLWSGFYFDKFPRDVAEPSWSVAGPPPDPASFGFAQAHGVLQTTGAFADACLPDDIFEHRPVIDAITEIRGIVGYLFWIDEEGAVHFQAPNWFLPGNYDENANFIDFTPEVDERVNATGYSVALSSENVRTQIVISSEAVPPIPPYGSAAEAYAAYRDAVSRATFYTPTEGREMWHGMKLPAMWVNAAFNEADEREAMAELIAMHIFYRGRQGSVTMQGNPCIQVNDQVRILERTTSETFINYVRGVTSTLDNTSGQYSMTLTTNWLGDGNDWVADRIGGDIIATRTGQINALTGQL